MLNQYIQAPYIKTLFGLATPALIISVIYLLGLGFYLAIAQKKGKVEIRVVDACELMQGD